MSFLHLHYMVFRYVLRYTSQHTIFTNWLSVSFSENFRPSFAHVYLYHHESFPAQVKEVWFCYEEHELYCVWATNNFYSSNVGMFLE